MKAMRQNDILPLIIKSKAGDEKATDLLYKEADKYLNTIVRPKDIPQGMSKEDIVQDILVKILENFQDRYKPRKGAFSSWISTIKKNHIASLFRKEKKEVEIVSPVSHNWDPFSSFYLNQLRKKLLRIFGLIENRKYSKALLLSFQKPPGQKYWAKVLNMNFNSFRSDASKGILQFNSVIQKNKNYAQIFHGIHILFEKNPAWGHLTDSELNLIENEKMKLALKKPAEHKEIKEVARDLGLTVDEYRSLVDEALEVLLRKLSKYRKKIIFEPITAAKKPTELFWEYQALLFESPNGMLMRAPEKFSFPGFYPYKEIADVLYALYTFPAMPLSPGELISYALDKKALSRDELCKKLQIDYHQLASYLCGNEKLPARLVKPVADFLDIDKKEVEFSVRYCK